DDADHSAAALQGGVGDKPHQTDATTPINQGYAFARQQFAHAYGNVPCAGVGPEARAAEDAQGGGGGKGHGFCLLMVIRDLPGPRRHGIISHWMGATPMAIGGRTVGRMMARTVLWLIVAGAVLTAGAAGI